MTTITELRLCPHCYTMIERIFSDKQEDTNLLLCPNCNRNLMSDVIMWLRGNKIHFKNDDIYRLKIIDTGGTEGLNLKVNLLKMRTYYAGMLVSTTDNKFIPRINDVIEYDKEVKEWFIVSGVDSRYCE